MRVNRPGSQILVITESRLHAIGFLALYLGFFAFWYYLTLDLGKIPTGVHLFDHVLDRLSAQPMLWLFVLAPVLSVPSVDHEMAVIHPNLGSFSSRQLFSEGGSARVAQTGSLRGF
jgi:hypothetical protein